jgi:L-amino acid N-acyltransferase YncA
MELVVVRPTAVLASSPAALKWNPNSSGARSDGRLGFTIFSRFQQRIQVLPMNNSTVEELYSPRTSILVNGEKVHFRMLEKRDEADLQKFFSQISDRDAEKLRHDVHDPEVIAAWTQNLNYSRALPVIALNEAMDRIIAAATMHFMTGVHRHIADVRIVVGRDYRKLGLGSALIKELIETGNRLGIHFLKAEILAESELAIKAFRQLGFEAKCTLEKYFMNRDGATRDVVLMFKRLLIEVEEEMFYLF